MARVVVVGGGAIGLASAYYLSQRGQSVVVLDKGEPGMGCSRGNMGWVCPSLSEPLPAPGLVLTSLRWALRSDSPLYIKPSAMPGMAGWLWNFWRHCNQRDFAAGFAAMAALNRHTLALYDQLEAAGLRFRMYRSGLMYAFLHEANLRHALADLEFGHQFGLSLPRRLSGDEVRDLEPALSREITGGLLLEQERHVRPEELTAALAEGARQRGADIRAGVEVTGLERRGDAIRAVLTTQGRIEADQVLIATGARLDRWVGFPLPLQAGKGYSLTIEQPSITVNRPLYLGDLKVAFTPFAGALRIGGTMELSGVNTILDPRRIANLRRAATRYLTLPRGSAETEWVGMRPITPDGLPIMGRIPGVANLYVAAGHGTLGITMAPVTGAAMAELISSGTSQFDLKPFDPARFLHRSRAGA